MTIGLLTILAAADISLISPTKVQAETVAQSGSLQLPGKDKVLKPVHEHYNQCKAIERKKQQLKEAKRRKRLRLKRKRIKNTPVYMGKFKITYYWIGEDSWGYQTKMGVRSSRFYTVAVDPNVIPLGSKIIIGNDIYWAVDTGGAVKGNVIDIFSESPLHDMYYNDVWILKKGSSEKLALRYKKK